MADNKGQEPPRSAMREYGVTGLDWTMGQILADSKWELRGSEGARTFDKMRREDPTVAATLLALSLPVREASWRVNPASDKGQDKEAAEFVESCLHDMSVSWDDVLTEVCTMFPFGWAFMEWVLKKRQGRFPRTGPASKYDDGRIGFRKMALRGQTSLYEWQMEDDGGILGMVQEDVHAVDSKPYKDVPLSKALLFRTTRERNNPEGQSILRPAWRPWMFKYNIERIEAIGLQRALMGMPVVKYETGFTTIDSAGMLSDEGKARTLIRELHDNTALGVVESPGMTFRFEVPDMQGITSDSSRVIQRLDEGIARSTLAMYILLGSQERGSYALSRELADLFFLAVDGFINIIAQVFNQWAVPVLMRWNAFPGIVEYPQIGTAINRRVDLTALAEFINKTVQAQVITPDPELEKHIRELADFPPRAVTVEGEEVTPVSGMAPGEGGGGAPEPPGEQGGGKETPEEASARGRLRFSSQEIDRYATSGRLQEYHTATDVYERRLRETYGQWMAQVDARLAATTAEDGIRGAQEQWRAAVAELLVLLREQAWEYLPQGMALGYRSPAMPPDVREVLNAELVANDGYMEENLAPAIEAELGIDEIQEVMLLYWGGQREDAKRVLDEAIQGRAGHVAKYAGHFWRLIWLGALTYMLNMGNDGPIAWFLDPIAQHCPTCVLFGGREYDSFNDLMQATGGILPGQGTECNGHCRCWLVRKYGVGLGEVI